MRILATTLNQGIRGLNKLTRYILSSLLFVYANTALAGSFTVFGSTDFERNTGAPVTEVVNFSVSQPADYTFTIFNGGLENDQFELVSSSVITLNGVEIASPSEFNQQTTLIEKTVQLQTNNILTVELRGRPGGGITIDIIGEDDVPPVITASLSSPANNNGWHNQDVVISYTCGDDFSGVVDCPPPVLVSGEGAAQSFTATVVDQANNTASVTTVINLDKSAPSISASLSTPANAAGWHNQDVVISYTCSDVISPSGNCPTSVTVDAEGAGQIFIASVSDLAGNVAESSVTVSLDKTPPILTSVLSSPANANGWHMADFTVSYQCGDGLSGVTECPPDNLVQTEGADQEIVATVNDIAGNSAQVIDVVSLDKTVPTIVATPSTPANEAGWHSQDVTISFTCTDTIPDALDCPEPVVVNTEGADQSITGSILDSAGNQADASIVVNLDKTLPVLTVPEAILVISESPIAIDIGSATATDNLSEPLISSDAPQDFPFGVTVVEWSATDLADNVATATQEVVLTSAPVITSTPVVDASVGVPYIYNVVASDPNGDEITFSLSGAPDSMEIDPSSGEITWLPQAGQTGLQEVTVVATDSFGAAAEQTYAINTATGERPFTHEGSEFWWSPTENVVPGNQRLYAFYFVSHEQDANVTITFDPANDPVVLSLPAGELVSYVFNETPLQGLPPNNLELNGQAVHIVADRNITAYAVNQVPNTTDGMLLLPVTSLGTEYLSANWLQSAPLHCCQYFSVIATEDNTQITANSPQDMFTHQIVDVALAGEDFTFILNKGEYRKMYGLLSQSGDYTGARISADKPVAVISETHCSNIPIGFGFCDHMEEMMPPLSSLSDEYFVAPLRSRIGYFIRVVAAEDETDVFVNGALVDHLDASRFYEQVYFDGIVVETSKPALVMQYAPSRQFDSDIREDFDASIGGDPFMSAVAPKEQYLKRYQINTPSQGFNQHNVSIIIPQSGINSFQVDGQPISASEFVQIHDSAMYFAEIETGPGTSRLTADEPFGVHVYGWGPDDSYGYVGGMGISRFDQLDSLTLTGNTTGAIGEEACVTATLTDISTAPVWGARLRFTVAGVRELEDYIITNEQGSAVFCYQGLQLGNETVGVEIDGLSDSLSVDWVPDSSGINHAPVVSSLPATLALKPGENFSYQLQVLEPEGDQLTYAMVNGPVGMSVDANGLVNWVANDLIDPEPVTVLVSDGLGGNTTHSFVLRKFQLFNTPPEFSIEPPLTAKQSKPYFYDPTRTPNSVAQIIPIFDADDDAHRITILEGSPNARITRQFTGGGWRNRLSWEPAADEAGQIDFVLEAVDVRGERATQSFSVDVDPNLPPIVLTTPSAFASVGNRYEYVPRVDDDTRDPNFIAANYSRPIVPIGMTVDGTSDANGITIRKLLWTPAANQIGTHTVRLEFFDEINTTVQEFTIEVTDSLPPSIDSAAITTAAVGRPYAYQLQVSDADDSVFNYQFEAAPDGMTIDTNGLISWTPSVEQEDTHPVRIVVDDTRGGYVRQQFDIVVTVGANTAPVIDSTPHTSVVIGLVYSYDVDASDAENDIITYSLESAPTGMSIDEHTGIISWTPDISQLGSNAATVRAADFGLFSDQSFNIEVTSDPLPLTASISVNPAVINVGESSLITVNVNGGQAATTASLIVNGNAVTLDGNNQASILGDTIGKYSLVATVSDGVETVIADAFFTVVDPTDVTPPVVEIVGPLDGDTVTSITDIIGTVTEVNLAEYRIKVAPARSGQFTTIATGDTEQTNAVLAQFDPTLLINGNYDILLEAVDFNGQLSQVFATVLVEGDLKVGNFSFTLLDLEIPVAGIPIRVTRTYDSRRRGELLDFGHGWSVGYQDIRVDESRTPGAGWEKYTFQSGPLGSITNFCVRPLGNPTVAVTLPDGDVERFVPVAVPECNLTNPNAPVALGFDPIGDTQSTLELTASISLVPQGENLVLLGNPAPFDPQLYRLTTRNELEYTIDQNFGVNRIDEPNGNFLTFDQAGIVHSTGKSIDFNRDGDGKITSITDPAGNVINYFYDANNDLIEAQDQVSVEANVVGSTYTYNTNHGLVDMFDPLGRRLVKNIYDDDGRLIAQEDENGVRTEFNHDLVGKQSIVTDRNGNITVFAYDDRGNVTSQVDAENGLTTFTYDANDNQLTQTDPLNNTSSATYNSSNDQLTQTDALLNTVEFTYNNRGDELTIEDARNNVFTNTYDTFGNLLTVEDPLTNVAGNNINAQGLVSLTQDVLGNTTSFTYDTDGNKLTETDAELNVTTFTYDDNGNVLTESRDRTVGGSTVTDVTTFEYDAMNRVTRTIDADNKITDTFYDGAGNQMAVLDPLGRLTEFEYDAYGRLTKTIFPDLTEAEKTYDPEGNLLTETDRLGRVTTFEYDKLNRLVKTTFDDLTFTETEYDAAGRVTAEIDERGNRTEHGYDDAGRRTSTTDALLNVTSFVYDEDGNLTSQTDANLHTTTFVYNALDQRTQTEFHDTSTIDEEFDALGRLTKRTDQDNKETQFEYDGLGRLTAVVDALNQRTEYEYDEAGNKTVQRDANLHETTWTYDALGRVLSRTLPLGQIESFTYDANGNQLTRTDFNGDTTNFEYDDNDRLEKVTYQDLSEDTFTYDAVGNRLTATDASGTITYAYDVRNRLELETKPDGSTLAYEYDEAGNRTEVMTTVVTNAGSTTLIDTHTFDVLNRLATSTDSGFNTTTYGYDDVGNRASIAHPNGNDTVYTYDDLNRLVDLSVFNGSSALVDQFVYTLLPTGRREVITELGGRVSTYVYDDLYRMTSEAIVDSVNGNHDAAYVYDLVGNRTSSTINGVTTAYNYDDNDRLTSAGGDTYSYDDNGNTLTKTESGVTTANVYDLRNKLVSSTTSGVTTSFDYDVNGLRTERGSGGSTTSFITDSNRDFGQVVAEVTDGDFVLGYSFGDDLLSQVFPGGSVFFFHYDGLGSTRSLSDNTGTFTDEYDYEAFGELTGSSGTTDNDYLFAGEQFDSALGDYYLRARYYDQGVGRFTQMDTFQGLENDPVTLHKYLYANADPVNGIDPSGNLTLVESTATFAVAATLAAIAVQSTDFSSLLDTSIDSPFSPSATGFATILIANPATGALISDILGLKFEELESTSGQTEPKISALTTAIDLIPKDKKTVYRVWGGLSGEFGASWTPLDPRLAGRAYRSLAGLPDVNTGVFLSIGILVNASGVTVFPGLPLDGNIGGWPEFLIPDPRTQVLIVELLSVSPPF